MAIVFLIAKSRKIVFPIENKFCEELIYVHDFIYLEKNLFILKKQNLTT